MGKYDAEERRIRAWLKEQVAVVSEDQIANSLMINIGIVLHLCHKLKREGVLRDGNEEPGTWEVGGER
jgi:hypothetical protein